jgi:cytochrome b561
MLDTLNGASSKTKSEMKPARYHWALVVLHWISAILILVALTTGVLWFQATPNTSPDKIAQLGAHMSLGIAILILTIARLAVRVFTPTPERAATGSAPLDRIAAATHYGLYVAIVLMAASGIMTAAMAGLPAIVFGGSREPLPATLSDLAPRIAHGVLAQIIVALVCLHLLGTLYHHFVRKDHPLRRMWFGARAGRRDRARSRAGRG